jgi:hypothetical protein
MISTLGLDPQSQALRHKNVCINIPVQKCGFDIKLEHSVIVVDSQKKHHLQ